MKVLSNNMFGLHRRQTYEELVGEIGKPLLNSYPDRKAINLRFSNWLTQLDSQGMREMDQQQVNAMKEQEKQNLLREYTMSTGTSHAVAKASVEEYQSPRERPSNLPTARTSGAVTPQMFDIYTDDELPRSGSLIPNLETSPEEAQQLRDAFRDFGFKHQLHGQAEQLQRLEAEHAAVRDLVDDLHGGLLADRAYAGSTEHKIREIHHRLEAVQRKQDQQSFLLPHLTDTVHTLVQQGGSSSSMGPLLAIQTPVGVDVPGELSSSDSEPPYVQVEPPKGTPEVEENYKKAMKNGKGYVTFREAHEWKEAFGNQMGEYKQQMWLRKLPTTDKMGKDTMIKRLIAYDRKHNEDASNYRAITARH